MIKDKVTAKKLIKYFNLTEKALGIAKKNIIKGREKDADEIVEMVENYLSDAEYFQKKGDFVSCFAALNYSHGWLDCGVRLGVFNVSDDRLFTVK